MNSTTFPNIFLSSTFFESFSKVVTSQKIQGRILHPNKDPISNQKIALFSPGWLKNSLIAETQTDSKGNFLLSYDWKHWGLEKEYAVLFQIFEKTVPSEIRLSERTTDSISITIPIQPAVHLGDLYSRLYESKEDFPSLANEDFKLRPQQHNASFNRELLFEGISNKLKSLFAEGFSFFAAEAPNCIFKIKDPHLTLTPENTIDLILNGLYPGYFRKGNSENEMVNVINWDRYDKDSSPDLPNVSLTLIKNKDKLEVKEVSIQYPEEEIQVYNENHPEFKRALYLFNSMALIKGEAVHHLGIGHLMTGQIALSFFRHIKNHPIRKLLVPHLDGVAEINRLGAGLIFGENGILNVAGLSSKGVDQILEDTLGSFDFSTFKPREPLVPNHLFAYAQKLYWKIVEEVVDQFFYENFAEIESEKSWYEVYLMSQNLMKQSLPYRPFEKQNENQKIEWIDQAEIDQPELGKRIEHKNQIKAIRPFISSPEKPNKEDLENLKQFCRFTLFVSTFYHWALHSSQGKWGTNLSFGSLAPENRAKAEFGGTKSENMIRQLEVATLLVDFDAPPLIDDPFKVIYKPFIEKLLHHKEEFNRLGYDITKLHYGVVI